MECTVLAVTCANVPTVMDVDADTYNTRMDLLFSESEFRRKYRFLLDEKVDVYDPIIGE